MFRALIVFYLYFSVQLEMFFGTQKENQNFLKDHIVCNNVDPYTRHKIRAIDLAKWMLKNLKTEDYVIFKLDVEGAEFTILR